MNRLFTLSCLILACYWAGAQAPRITTHFPANLEVSAVAQGNISDYLWQKWVWRGLLLFTADPIDFMAELERRVDA